MSDKNDNRVVPIIMPRALAKTLKETAVRSEQSASSIIRCMLEEYLCTPKLKGEFRPHAVIQTVKTVPDQGQISSAIVTRAADFKLLQLDLTQPPESFPRQAIDALRQRLTELGTGSALPFFGGVTGVTVNYTATHAVTYDLNGNPIAVLPSAIAVDRGEISME